MASKRQQARMFFQRVPSQHLSGTTLDALTTRCETYLIAVDVWASKGNAKALRDAGSGIVAICAWKAAKTLAEDALLEPFLKESGLSPKQFSASEIEFTPAFQSISMPSTPRKSAMNRSFKLSDMASFSSLSSPNSQDQSPEARRKRAMDVASGAAFAKMTSSPLSQGQGSKLFHNRDGDDSALQTPNSRTLRDRSSIKERKIYDPSQDEMTPTRRSVVFYTPTSNSQMEGQARKRPRELAEEMAAASPSKQPLIAQRRHKLLLGYPAGEPLRKGGTEVMGEWNNSRCKAIINRYIAALDRCPDPQRWEKDVSISQIRLSL